MAKQNNTAVTGFRGEAKRLASYLTEVGRPLKHGQCLDAVARVHGARDWNVLAAQAATPAESVPVASPDVVRGRRGDNAPLDMTQATAPLTAAQLWQLTEAGKHFIEIVVAVDFTDLLYGDIQSLNNLVSEKITGNDGALAGLCYSVAHGYGLDASQVGILVVAQVEFDMLDDLPVEKYCLSEGWDHLFPGCRSPRAVRFVLDWETMDMVRVEILTATGYVLASADESADLARSVEDNLSLQSPEDLELVFSDVLPDWAQ